MKKASARLLKELRRHRVQAAAIFNVEVPPIHSVRERNIIRTDRHSLPPEILGSAMRSALLSRDNFRVYATNAGATLKTYQSLRSTDPKMLGPYPVTLNLSELNDHASEERKGFSMDFEDDDNVAVKILKMPLMA